MHVSLSLAVANEILSNPGAPGVRVLCKILTMMDLTGCAQSNIKEMKVLTTRIMEVCSIKSFISLHFARLSIIYLNYSLQHQVFPP